MSAGSGQKAENTVTKKAQSLTLGICNQKPESLARAGIVRVRKRVLDGKPHAWMGVALKV